MITYNWDLGYKILLVFIITNFIFAIPLGLTGKSKSEYYTIGDTLYALGVLAVFSIPLFF